MADTEIRPFAPLYQPQQNIAPSAGQPAVQAQQGQFLPGVSVTGVSNAAAASARLPGQQGQNGPVQFYVANKLAVWAHVNFGTLNQSGAVRAATRTDPGIPPGTVAVFTVNPECDGASVFADGTVGAAPADIVVFTRGSGT